MEPADKEKTAFEWLLSEQAFANERIAAYSESEQKIIAVMTTVVVAILGLSLSKQGPVDEAHMPYILFLASGLLSLAVLQSATYSSLALLFMERKTKLSGQLEKFLDREPNFSQTAYSLFDLRYTNSYALGVYGYFTFKCVAGLVLAIAGYQYVGKNHAGPLWWSFLSALLLAIVSMGATAYHLVELYKFKSDMKLKMATDAKAKAEKASLPGKAT